MKKEIIIILIIIALIIIGIFSYYQIKNNGSLNLGGQVIKENLSKDSGDDKNKGDNVIGEGLENTGSLDYKDVGSSNGSGLSDGESGSNEGVDEIEDNPIDIENTPCGTYFQESGVCGGTCPEGVCGSDGKSCYCQKI